MKTPEKLSERVQVPMTLMERNRLKRLSIEQDRSVAYVARSFIIKGLASADKQRRAAQ